MFLNLSQDGNTMIEIFIFGSDRENIGQFMVAGGFSPAQAATSWAVPKSLACPKNLWKTTRTGFFFVLNS